MMNDGKCIKVNMTQLIIRLLRSDIVFAVIIFAQQKTKPNAYFLKCSKRISGYLTRKELCTSVQATKN